MTILVLKYHDTFFVHRGRAYLLYFLQAFAARLALRRGACRLRTRSLDECSCCVNVGDGPEVVISIKVYKLSCYSFHRICLIYMSGILYSILLDTWDSLWILMFQGSLLA